MQENSKLLIINIIYSFNFSCFHGIVPGLGTKQKAKSLIIQHLAFLVLEEFTVIQLRQDLYFYL